MQMFGDVRRGAIFFSCHLCLHHVSVLCNYGTVHHGDASYDVVDQRWLSSSFSLIPSSVHINDRFAWVRSAMLAPTVYQPLE
jgi:hypothetical protein